MSHILARTHRPVTRHTYTENLAYGRDLGTDAADLPAPSARVFPLPGPVSTPEADATIAQLLAPHMSADWLASLTNGMAPGVIAALRTIEEAS